MASKGGVRKVKRQVKQARPKRAISPKKASAVRPKKAPVRPRKAPKPKRAKKGGAPGARAKAPERVKAEPVRLLRETKATTAALSMLERGIKLIYQKDFKRARTELKLLMESYPGETEILAGARTYLQICAREEAAHRKPVVANDELYAMGVVEHNRADYAKALSYFSQSLEKHQDSDHIYYSLAATLAMKGDRADALRNLRKAIELNEENRVFAKNDSDFTPLHSEKEFLDLIGSSQPVRSWHSE
jgi:tetratricopeptide (TPR) repeat protein